MGAVPRAVAPRWSTPWIRRGSPGRAMRSVSPAACIPAVLREPAGVIRWSPRGGSSCTGSAVVGRTWSMRTRHSEGEVWRSLIDPPDAPEAYLKSQFTALETDVGTTAPRSRRRHHRLFRRSYRQEALAAGVPGAWDQPRSGLQSALRALREGWRPLPVGLGRPGLRPRRRHRQDPLGERPRASSRRVRPGRRDLQRLASPLQCHRGAAQHLGGLRRRRGRHGRRDATSSEASAPSAWWASTRRPAGACGRCRTASLR